MSRRSNEPFWWAPFSGGMMIDALTIPALILLTGVLLPFGLVSTNGLRGLLLHPLARLVLFGIIALSFFHAAHRMRFMVSDLIGRREARPFLGYLFYSLAILGTALAGAVALRVF